ncbi:hypothetical protein PACID_28970 [Acidipropionibacterium acidipropionici ATCC 4875]|uniref:Uncharacterized protein n=1 Tax=Acidipropionibacterium acidipropionici (strain ATCC 4875 / DSM 20272 / JCM 6432 / NBRC 12425 / NCIMB 8070 / 4) TaxID=1171373 RepID=K7S027_ACIA4|nr:hypothetical protein PACID_28970 [Acidipropionibacterium acidipropionici ATCC 4875]
MTSPCTLARPVPFGKARCRIGFQIVGARSPTVRVDQNPNVNAATTSAWVGRELSPRFASLNRARLA